MPDVPLKGVVIAEDHEVYRMGLRLIIEDMPGYTLCGEAATGDEVLEVVRQHAPDLLIVDYAMPGMTGLDVIYALRRRHIPTRVLALTAIQSTAILAELLSAGADGICLKQESTDELRRAIDLTGSGSGYLSPAVEPLSIRAQGLAKLTRRERQVLMQVITGGRNKEIARTLNISPKTVDVHRTNLMKKLDLHSVAELIDFANQSGLLDQMPR